jgi:hypothetical protein
MDTESRAALEVEYANHRCGFGDWDDDEEAMTSQERFEHFLARAKRLTDQQLLDACNSYATAD